MMENPGKKLQSPILLKFSWYIGLTAFIGGWLIFISWASARYFAVINLNKLAIFGIFWMFIFFWLCLAALILLLIYVVKNRSKLHWKMLLTAVMILINIPSVVVIITLFSEIESKAFVKFSNESEIELMQIQIIGNGNSWDLGKIRKGSSEIVNFDPDSAIDNSMSYEIYDKFHLIINHRGKNDTLDLPPIYSGDCKEFIIGSNLEIKEIFN